MTSERRAAALQRQLQPGGASGSSGMSSGSSELNAQPASAYAVRCAAAAAACALAPPSRRLLARCVHSRPASRPQPSTRINQPSGNHRRQLPRFDVTLMEQFLEEQRGLKSEVYEL